MKKRDEILNVFRNEGLNQSRIISMSKSGYRSRYPDNLVIFNARIAIGGYKVIWSGDLDITLDAPFLQRVSDKINKNLYVMHEMLGGWDAEKMPLRFYKKHATAMFIPRSNHYKRRVTEGIEGVTIGHTTVITGKGVGWKEVMPRKP